MTMYSPTGGEAAQMMQGPQRTSVAAILSLVSGILGLVICCFPPVGIVFAVLGALCAIFAFMAIGRSDGRIGGRGLAVGGLVCSIIGMLLGVMVFFGAAKATAEFKKYEPVITAAQSADATALASHVSSVAAQGLTQEQLTAFSNESIGSLGKFQNIKPGLGMWLKAFGLMSGVAPSLPQKYQGNPTQTMIPLAADFEKGDGLVLLVVDSDQSTGLPVGKIINIGVAPNGGPITWLIDPSGP